MSHSGIPVWKPQPYVRPDDLDCSEPRRMPVLIVGAGPIGLAMALDLGRKGHAVTVVSAMPFIAAGSKAICFSKRTLDICDRLGVGGRMLDKGVVWNVGKVFWRGGEEPIYRFDLLPVKRQRNPAFINLQQYYVEEYLCDALERLNNVEIRWGHELTELEQVDDGVRVRIRTPDGEYDAVSDYLLACDGARSRVRELMGLDFEGRVFEDNFLIADVRFAEARPAERWFHFEPPYPGWSSLCHKQPDGVWRLDFQLGWDIDKREAVKPENVDPFVRGFLGDDVEFEYEWISVYTFQCRRMARFVHDRVIFAGDSAHLVSPFGARGCNGGFADVDNLAWKLDRVLCGEADAVLLESYNHEAVVTADENILNSSRATDFLTPKTAVSKAYRDAVLALAGDFEFARPYVNSGRLSTAVSYPDSPINATDSEVLPEGPRAGDPCVDAPIEADGHAEWLLAQLGGQFGLLRFGDVPDSLAQWAMRRGVALRAVGSSQLTDCEGLVCERYGGGSGVTYLVRPDQYVAGCWVDPSPAALDAALSRAGGLRAA